MKLPGRNETTEKIQAVRRKIKSLEAEACAVEVALDVRRRQASLLSQVLRDLGQTIQVSGRGAGEAVIMNSQFGHGLAWPGAECFGQHSSYVRHQ